MKKILAVVTLVVALLFGVGLSLYVRNPAPSVPPLSAEAARAGKPYVVKLHAQWCVNCMMTKRVWAQIEETYANRANLVVFDFTTDGDAEASRAEATRLGLTGFFEEYGGATGTIVILDGRTKEVTASITASRDFSEYRAAIDAALERAGH